MKTKENYRVLSGCVLLAAIVAWFVLRNSGGAPNVPAVASPPEKPLTELTTPALAALTAAPVAPSVVVPVVEIDSRVESLATARMYAAHAPLREPTVANPDSAENREILRSMVFKALAGPAPAQPSTHVPTYSSP